MRVRFTPRAPADLQDIYAYFFTHSPRGAMNVRGAIRNAAALLGQYPNRGQPTDKLGVRRVAVIRYRYAIYFRVRDEVVEIVHIRHGARRPPTAGEF